MKMNNFNSLALQFFPKAQPSADSSVASPKTLEEWRLALSNPDSYEHKEMIKTIMGKLAEKKFLEECIGAVVVSMVSNNAIANAAKKNVTAF